MPQRPIEVRDPVDGPPANLSVGGVSLCLRRATDADVRALVTLVNAAYQQSEKHLFPGSRRTERDQILQQLDAVIVAEIDGRIVACIRIETSRDPAHFGMLAVEAELQASGIGSMLVAQAERVAQHAGCARMDIETVKEAGLIPFYERRGYRVTREILGQVWNNGADWGAAIDWHMVEMEKNLW